MGKATGFLEFKREEAGHRSVAERIGDYRSFSLPCTPDHVRTQSSRCMDCGVPFCHAGLLVAQGSIGCPLGTLIPEVNDLVYKGCMDEAFGRLSLKHPFPEITGRVCPALCEGSCTAGQHFEPVAIRDIERTLADYGFENRLGCLQKAASTGRNVAIVGSGPSGLACADTLSRLGHAVTVFERDDRPGGFLMYGIPNMKLEKHIVETRISLLGKQGVVFQLGVDVGCEYALDTLTQNHDAVVLCIGSRQQRELSIPGSELSGVSSAVAYLTAATRSLLEGNEVPEVLNAEGKDVIVIGGGDTGTDCVATAIRQGARSVAALEIMPELPRKRAEDNPWPLWPRIRKTDYGHEEARAVYGRDIREYETTVRSIQGSNGSVTSVQSVKVSWQKDSEGRFVAQEVDGTLRNRSASLVLTAMGFVGVERRIPEALSLALTPRNTLATQAGAGHLGNGYATGIPGIFAAGDARRGPSLVVWSIQEGREAAQACHDYLMR